MSFLESFSTFFLAFLFKSTINSLKYLTKKKKDLDFLSIVWILNIQWVRDFFWNQKPLLYSNIFLRLLCSKFSMVFVTQRILLLGKFLIWIIITVRYNKKNVPFFLYRYFESQFRTLESIVLANPPPPHVFLNTYSFMRGRSLVKENLSFFLC